MLQNRYKNNKVNRLHKSALRNVYEDYELFFEQLLEKDQLFSIHYQNFDRLLIEICKACNKI